jgi:hypothetical protein
MCILAYAHDTHTHTVTFTSPINIKSNMVSACYVIGVVYVILVHAQDFSVLYLKHA